MLCFEVDKNVKNVDFKRMVMNRRVLMTKNMLRSAFLELLKEKPIDKITIYELCARADINRTTFYKYYGSQYDLLNELEQMLFEGLNETLLEETSSDYEKMKLILEFLASDKETARLLINTVSDHAFTENLFGLPAIKKLVKNKTSDTLDGASEEYLRLFFCHGGYAVIRKWLNAGCEETPSEMAQLLTDFISMRSL